MRPETDAPAAPQIIAIGCSMGGLDALRVLLGGLDARLTQAVLVCAHAGGQSDIDAQCSLLGRHSSLPVIEARERHPLQGGHVHLAPGGYHLLIEQDRRFVLTVDEMVRFSRPSIDVMFESVAEVYGKAAIGVVLTGANSDGAEGLGCIRRFGGSAVVQSPATAEVPAMPQAALDVAGADYCLALDRIAPLLNRLCLR